MCAVDRRDHATVEALLKGGANPNARLPDDGRTALHFAVQERDARMTELLLAHKADVNARDQNGLTPLDYAEGRTQPSLAPTALAPPDPLPSPARAVRAPDQSRASAASVAELLRQHGALGNLPDWASIRLTRQGMGSPWVVFRTDTNDWNRFTLLEALRRIYSAKSVVVGGSVVIPMKSFAFPNLSELVIHRPSRTPGGQAQAIKVNLLNASNTVDCTQNIWLEFGDVIEIPERERTLTETTDHRILAYTAAMDDCIRKRVRLIVREQSKDLDLMGWAYLTDAMQNAVARSLLRTSSDLSRVKVTRNDPQTGKTREFVVDVAAKPSETSDLWLRDGDVIEVPEKE
jgi:hypothetical protein